MAYPMLEELADVLSYPRFASRLSTLNVLPSELILYALELSYFFDVIPLDEPIVIADPDDDIFLLCAESAAAKYVLSGDSHLLNIQRHKNIPIISLQEFFNQEFPGVVVE